MPVSTDIPKLAEQLTSGNRRALAKAITLAESRNQRNSEQAQVLLETIMPQTGNSVRIGITGVPGVGKSTFIETFGLHLIAQGHRVAVLAIDPSSPNSGGSILGDKTRMQELMSREEAFIRPSPTAGTLGGVARKTRESILLAEAAGYDIILIETVGVGQSEYEVASMTDFFLMLMLPGGGDSLQGIKKGIVELADVIVINKADGEMEKAAQQARADYENAIQLLHPGEDGSRPNVMTCSALQQTGIGAIWEHISGIINRNKTDGLFEKRRKKQLADWVHRLIQEAVIDFVLGDEKRKKDITELIKSVTDGKLTALHAVTAFREKYLPSD